MPVYTFECCKCKHLFELFASYSNYNSAKVECPKCQSKKVERSYGIDLQNMTGSVVKSDADMKLGDLANRNRDRMSDDHKQHLYNKHNKYKDPSFNKPLPKGMSRTKRKNKTKWT
tara:strand:+ start:789 stop:1133 length:345 start_codon:yes stop_codon:yes gene_type:complete